MRGACSSFDDISAEEQMRTIGCCRGCVLRCFDGGRGGGGYGDDDEKACLYLLSLTPFHLALYYRPLRCGRV